MLNKYTIASITTTSNECVRYDMEFVAVSLNGETVYHVNYASYTEKRVVRATSKIFDNYDDAREYYMEELFYLSQPKFLAYDNDDNRLCFD